MMEYRGCTFTVFMGKGAYSGMTGWKYRWEWNTVPGWKYPFESDVFPTEEQAIREAKKHIDERLS